MKISLKQLMECGIIILRTSTLPRKDWFWIFTTIFFTMLRHPKSIFEQKWGESKTNLLSDYLPYPITVKNPQGLLFFARPKFDDMARFLFVKPLSKWEPISLIKLKENEVMIDVGANTGYYSLKLAKENQKSKILAAEADPETCKVLEKNYALNKFTNVKIYNFAITDKDGEVTLNQSETHSGSNSIFSQNILSINSKTVTVPSITLDSLLAEKFKTIHWIKVDVEGAELLVLRGGPKTLKITKNIVIEVHEDILKQNNESPEEILKILKSNGFKIKLFPEYWNSKTSRNPSLGSDYILGEK